MGSNPICLVKKFMVKLVNIIKIKVCPNEVTPASQKIAPFLGPYLNISKFCMDLKGKVQNYKENIPLTIFVSAYSDKSFTYVIKPPSSSYFLKKVMTLPKGSSSPKHQISGNLSLKVLYEVAKYKHTLTNETISLKSYCKSLIGTAISMGLNLKK